jgi:hypothetical protein
MQAVTDEIAKAAATKQVADQEVAAIGTRILALQAPTDASLITSRATVLRDIIAGQVHCKVTQCPVCGRDGAQFETALFALDKVLGELVRSTQATQREVEALLAKSNELCRAHESVMAKLETKRNDLGRQGVSLMQQYGTAVAAENECRFQLDLATQEMQQAVPTKPVEPDKYTGLTSNMLVSRINQIKAAETHLATAGRLDIECALLADRSSDLRTCEKAVNTMVEELTAKTAPAALRRVNQFMPKGFSASLDLNAGRPWAVVGGDGRPHPLGAMTGSQECMLTLALAQAWPTGDGPRLVLIDDDLSGRLPDAMLRDLMDKVQEMHGQGQIHGAVVTLFPERAHCIPPNDKWSVVKTEK